MRVLTLNTRDGPLDVLAEPDGSGGYARLRANAIEATVAGSDGADRRPRGSDRDEEGGRAAEGPDLRRGARGDPKAASWVGRPEWPPLPRCLDQLIERFDASAFDAPAGRARLRLRVDDVGDWDFVIRGGSWRLEPADRNLRADARLCADRATWARVARDLRGGMNAFRGGRLQIRDDLHLGVGFLAATSGSREPGRLVLARVRTAMGNIAVARAGHPDAEPVVMLHGLGGTKASFLPTVAALADEYRVHAIDLPGFGDSVKPLRRRLRPALLRPRGRAASWTRAGSSART